MLFPARVWVNSLQLLIWTRLLPEPPISARGSMNYSSSTLPQPGSLTFLHQGGVARLLEGTTPVQRRRGIAKPKASADQGLRGSPGLSDSSERREMLFHDPAAISLPEERMLFFGLGFTKYG